jgi:hypothetical protein
MAIHIRRREIIVTLGGAAAWPLAAQAQQQQPAMPVIGFLDQRSAADNTRVIAEFRQGLGCCARAASGHAAAASERP